MKIKLHAENKYMHLLIVLVAIFFVSPFAEIMRTPFPLISFIFLTAILLTLRALELDRRHFLGASAIGIMALAIQVSVRACSYAPLREVLSVSVFVLYLAFILFAIVVMIKKMFSAEKVTEDTIIGGISVYFLLGFLWSLFYFMVYHFDKDAFYHSALTRHPHLFYYSFTTLTTVGYGDIYPVNKIAMALANLEAICGQMYLGIFIARLVGLHTAHKIRPDK